MARRYFEYNSPVDDSAWRNIMGGGFRQQLLWGFKPSVSNAALGTISISNGGVVLDSGTFLHEDIVKEVTIPLGAPAVYYTVHFEHVVDQIVGGSQAVLTVEQGLIFHDLTDSKTPLFWVVYPGSNAQLSNAHIFPALSFNDLVLQNHRTIGRRYAPVQASSNDSDVTNDEGLASSGIIQHEIELDPGAGAPVNLQSLSFPCWFSVGKPRRLVFEVEVETACEITAVAVKDLEGTTVDLDSLGTTLALPITANGAMNKYTLFLGGTTGAGSATAKWDVPGYYTVVFTVTLDPGASINFRDVSVRLMGEDE